MAKAEVKRNKVTPLSGNSSFISGIRDIIQAISKNNASVLLIGERGTGKRLVATHLHYAVSEEKKDFIEINSKTFSDEDIRTVFLGLEKFFFTEKRITFFVNYVDELSDDIQIAFLNLIHKIQEKRLNIKVVCSTEKDLDTMVQTGLFNKDLYYLLNTVSLNILPLRARKDDILPVVEYYLETFGKQSGYGFLSYSEDAKNILEQHSWPGNIDELINSIQRAFIVGHPPLLKAGDFGIAEVHNKEKLYDIDLCDKSLKTAVDEFKKEYVRKVLEETGWNQTKAAKILGIQRTYVIRLINELHIRK